MPAPTLPWDETDPANSQDPTFGAQRIRETRQMLRERAINGGIKWETSSPSTDANAGKLTCGVQGTTGILNLAHEADGDVAVVVRDGTDAGGDAEVQLGTGVGGARPYQLLVDDLTTASVATTTVTATTVTASGTVTGATVVASSVLTMPAKTVHNAQGTANTGTITLTGSYQVISTQAITAKSGTAGTMLILWSGTVILGAGTTVDARLMRGASVVVEILGIVTNPTGTGAFAVRTPFLYLDGGATAGISNTYEIQAKVSSGGADIGSNSRVITIVEFRNN